MIGSGESSQTGSWRRSVLDFLIFLIIIGNILSYLMSDPTVNLTLELACTVGSVDNALEALEEGADIDHGGGAPLFNAIFNRNLDVILMLVERGADLSNFISPAKQAALGSTEETIEMLMECAPPDPNAIDPGILGEMDATIRSKGLGKPILEGDWEGMVAYVEKLERIGAPEMSAVVAEVIELLRPAQSFGDAALFEAVKAEKKGIAAITERYESIQMPFSIEEMARQFLDGEEKGEVSGSSSEESDSVDSHRSDDSEAGDEISAIAV